MKAATERKIIRWFHILASIPIIGFVYGPVSTIPEAVVMVRWVIFPLVILSGLWMWNGHVVKKWFR
jgi:thiosulfate reductase cytochrome b subunit